MFTVIVGAMAIFGAFTQYARVGKAIVDNEHAQKLARSAADYATTVIDKGTQKLKNKQKLKFSCYLRELSYKYDTGLSIRSLF